MTMIKKNPTIDDLVKILAKVHIVTIKKFDVDDKNKSLNLYFSCANGNAELTYEDNTLILEYERDLIFDMMGGYK